MVVKKKTDPQQPCRTQSVMVRQDEAQRSNDMRRDPPQDLAFDQRLANQAELVIFEIAQATMHELGREGRRPAGQIVHFAKENRVAAPGRVTRDAAAIDTAADDREIKNP